MSRSRLLAIIAQAAIAAMALAGCVVGPDYHRPTIALTPAYRTAGIPACEFLIVGAAAR